MKIKEMNVTPIATCWRNCIKSYSDCGLTEHNDEVEIQKVEPRWMFEALRW